VSSIMNSFILVNYFCLKYPLVFLLGLHVYHIFELSKLKGVW
jgi:energy-converting hydrogenase Eha subunit F